MEPSQNNKDPIKFYHEGEEFGEFSNFYKAEVEIDEKTWPTTEHYFQAQKFASTNPNYVEKIRLSETPTEAKKLGSSKDVKLRDDWEDVKYSIMVKALEAKFTQHAKLRKVLLSTGDRMLIENSTRDAVWGCGKDGTGTNWLGKALMEIRAKLKKEKE